MILILQMKLVKFILKFIVKLIDSLLLLQYLKTEFNSSFIMDSRWSRLSLVKKIFVSSANIRKDSFFEQFGKSLM